MNFKRIFNNPRTLSALIGVTRKEFEDLLPTFEKEWALSKKRQHAREGSKRKIGGGRKGFMPTIAEKLFFILLYCKCYPTYDFLSVLYDCNRSNACRRQFEMMALLEKSLKRKIVLPKRQIRNMEEFLRFFPEAKELFIDGTERPVQRPKDGKKQKENYSGKKKKHTRKNIVIADKKRRVRFLGKTVNGKDNDFAILKRQCSPDKMPKGVKKHVDSGFQGWDKQFPGHTVSMPKKKSKYHPLTEHDKQRNKRKSRKRVLVENVLAGVKRLRIVADIFRNKRSGFDDTVMNVSCGLWNFHLETR